MTLLFRIVYATHANGTHHKLALDALNLMQGPDAERWRRLFLSQVERFLEGSKAPDKEFKDFKNHVCHARDEFWGGAPAKAANWYGHTVDALRDQDWDRAAYSAGVLSHYFTDPVMPFHTAQSEAENNIHRAAEWSVNKSYDDLFKRAGKELPIPNIIFEDREDWVAEAVRDAATMSNEFYEKLILHYDIHKGAVTPTEGFDEHARRFISGLLKYAATGYGRLLERAIAEAGVAAPDVSLTAATVVAGLRIPVRWVTRKLTDVADRKLVEAMYDELQATGTVRDTLPDDDRIVRDLHAKEVLGKTDDDIDDDDVVPVNEPQRLREMLDDEYDYDEDSEEIGDDDDQSASLEEGGAIISGQPVSSVAEPKAESKPEQPTVTEAASEQHAPPAAAPRDSEFYLKTSDVVEDAPSIGAKTADRLLDANILTVADLLDRDPEALSEQIDAWYITAKTVADWQDQAQLCCTIPRLKGRAAQWLVAVGYRTCDQVADADPVALHKAMRAFAATEAGERLLRNGDVPPPDEIADWIEQAASQQAVVAA